MKPYKFLYHNKPNSLTHFVPVGIFTGTNPGNNGKKWRMTFDVWRRLSSLHITFYAWPLFLGLFFGNPVSSFLDIHWIVTLSIIIRIFLSLLLVMFSLQQLQNHFENSDISHLLEVKKALLAAIDRKEVEDSVISDNEEPTQSIFHKGDLGNFLPEYNKQVSPI